MDAYWTLNSSLMTEEGAASKNECTGSAWTTEEDKAFENAIATYYNDADMWDKIVLAVPGKTIEDIKLHYEALSIDVEAINSGKVPSPDYPSKVSDQKERTKSPTHGEQATRGMPWTEEEHRERDIKVSDQKETKKSPTHGEQATRGVPWTEEEHRQFLYGLERFGRGDWKSIARYSVRTKSNSQVASHAQKYFKRLGTVKDCRRLSINDIRTVNPEKLLALEKATTSCMPVCFKGKSTNAGTEELHLGNPVTASNHAKNQQLPQDTMEASLDPGFQLLPECPNKASVSARKRRMPRRPKKASTAVNQRLPGYPKEASTSVGNQLLPGYAKKAPTVTGIQLLPGHPKRARSDTEYQLLPGYPKRARSDTGNNLLPPPPFSAMSVDPPFSCQAIGIDTGSQSKDATTNLGNQLLAGYPVEASTGHGNQLLAPSPFTGMSSYNSPYSGQAIGGPSFSAPMLPACNMPTPPFASQPIQEPRPPIQEAGPSMVIPGFYPSDAEMLDADGAITGAFDVGSSTEIMDLDLSLFPHFLD